MQIPSVSCWCSCSVHLPRRRPTTSSGWREGVSRMGSAPRTGMQCSSLTVTAAVSCHAHAARGLWVQAAPCVMAGTYLARAQAESRATRSPRPRARPKSAAVECRGGRAGAAASMPRRSHSRSEGAGRGWVPYQHAASAYHVCMPRLHATSACHVCMPRLHADRCVDGEEATSKRQVGARQRGKRTRRGAAGWPAITTIVCGGAPRLEGTGWRTSLPFCERHDGGERAVLRRPDR